MMNLSNGMYVDGNQLFEQAPDDLNILESHCLILSHTALFSYHANKKLQYFPKNGTSLDGSLLHVIYIIE